MDATQSPAPLATSSSASPGHRRRFPHHAVSTARTPESSNDTSSRRSSILIGATIVCGVALAAGEILNRTGVIDPTVALGFYVTAYVAGGTAATRKALTSLWRRTIDIDLLMIVAAAGAAVIGQWAEGGILLFLFSLGNALQAFAMGRTYRAVRALMALSPDDALVLRDGVETRIAIDALRVGDRIVVKPGERVAADGVVENGESAIDQSPITGESMPVTKRVGDPVFAATINGRGALLVRATRLAHESTVAKIIAIVQEAQAQKSTAQRFTDRFEGYYAAGVIVAATLYGALLVMLVGREPSAALYMAMILLVVASPCALIISTPASTLSALANAARHGILIKGALHLENLGVATVVAFDKTGTLTMGRPRVTDVRPVSGVSDATLLAIAASVERRSEHPLAQAVVDAATERDLPLADVTNPEALTGRGMRATLDQATVFIGNVAPFEEQGIVIPDAARHDIAVLSDDGKTTMLVGRSQPDGDVVLGVIGVADTIRPEAREIVAQLSSLGVERTVILTGDTERAAHAIARQCGIDDYRSGLLPQQKLEVIAELKQADRSVVMVGDGVNDAPALAAATTGVAMGAAGTDVALETADIVLMADDLSKLPYVIALSRKTRQVIRQNLTFALTVIAILVVGTLFQITTLSIGVVGHEGSTIIVVANGLRLLRGLPIPRDAAMIRRTAVDGAHTEISASV